MENLTTLSIDEFNNIYKSKGLKIELLTSFNQWEDFKNNFSFGLDYRVSIENTSTSVSVLNPLSFNKDFITSEVILLYQKGVPAGVATLIVEPKDILKTYNGFFLDGAFAKVTSLESALGVLPDFSIVRGWRVLNRNLRGFGIGTALRNVISYRINLLLEKNSLNYKIMFIGMVASSLNATERGILQNILDTNVFGESIDINTISVNKDLLGRPSEVSIAAYKDYIKDGFLLVPNYVFPKSFGPVFYKRFNF